MWNIADGGCNDAFVLGPANEVLPAGSYAGLELSVMRNDDVASTGKGVNALGGPDIALAWLANYLNAQGLMLKAGDVVTTGVVTGLIYVEPGDEKLETFSIDEDLDDLVADLRGEVALMLTSDEIRVGIVGLGGRGTGAHLPSFQKQSGVKVVALSDPDRQRMANAAKIAESKYGQRVEQYVDMRSMFDRQDIDVIGNATQNYWHGLSTIWACQAGKHVYVEKPLSHYIWEGRQIVNAARKYGRIVQTGTQSRSAPGTREFVGDRLLDELLFKLANSAKDDLADVFQCGPPCYPARRAARS